MLSDIFKLSLFNLSLSKDKEVVLYKFINLFKLSYGSSTAHTKFSSYRETALCSTISFIPINSPNFKYRVYYSIEDIKNQVNSYSKL